MQRRRWHRGYQDVEEARCEVIPPQEQFHLPQGEGRSGAGPWWCSHNPANTFQASELHTSTCPPLPKVSSGTHGISWSSLSWGGFASAAWEIFQTLSCSDVWTPVCGHLSLSQGHQGPLSAFSLWCDLESTRQLLSVVQDESFLFSYFLVHGISLVSPPSPLFLSIPLFGSFFLLNRSKLFIGKFPLSFSHLQFLCWDFWFLNFFQECPWWLAKVFLQESLDFLKHFCSLIPYWKGKETDRALPPTHAHGSQRCARLKPGAQDSAGSPT